jgi:hypothetical protein
MFSCGKNRLRIYSLNGGCVVTEKGYFPPFKSASGGIKELMLIYNNYGANWTPMDALPYVAYLDNLTKEPVVKDWFFDAFLFLALLSEKGRAFDSPQRATPAIKEDWQWYINDLFRPNRQLSAFNEAYKIAKPHLDKNNKGKVFVMIPNPMDEITEFGLIDGENLDFSSKDPEEATRQRFKAVKWFVDNVIEQYRQANFDNLELVGFYWVEEMIHFETAGETNLVQKVADYLHQLGLKFCWIPWFRAAGHDIWAKVGFDFCIHQPNYMFNDSVPKERFEYVTKDAKEFYQGIEIEADPRVLESVVARERFRDYLRAGITYGYMNEAIHGYYQDVKVFGIAAYSEDPNVRAIYDDVYKFVKGTWLEGLK